MRTLQQPEAPERPELAGLPECPLCAGHPFHFDRVFPGENWTRAVEEEGLDPNNISLFGRLAPKLPRSVVEKYISLNHTKVHRYSFLGSALNGRVDFYQSRRAWVADFAKRHFTDKDFLSIADVPEDWVRLGSYDHSAMDPKYAALLQTASGGSLHSRSVVESAWFNRSKFWRVTAASEFALCPGGDGPWSKRSFEVALAGAIPVIKKPKADWRPGESEQLSKGVLQAILDKIRYVLVDDVPHVRYSRELADENWRTVIKYMTFMEGDNEIPGLMRCVCHGREALM